MSGAKWQARVESGPEVGAGFLVSPRTVLTCAHVVTGGAPVTVTFPQLPGEAPVPARVQLHGGWQGGTAPGDLAVLALDRDMDIPPAEFALPGAAFGDPPPRLLAYGFPRHYDEGTLAEYRAKSDLLIGNEWVELVAVDGHGQPMEAGFSGAAVTLAGTHRVVGMVTQATGGRGVLAGRMLPLNVMLRHWPALGELLPVRPRPATNRLRALVERAERTGLDCDPGRLFHDAADGFGPRDAPDGGFRSLGDAALYIATEVGDPDMLLRFTDLLEELLHPSRQRRWAPVLIDVRRSGAGEDQALVEVSTYSEGRRRPVGTRTVHERNVATYVRDVIDEALRELPYGTDELVAFTLPGEWLNWPVDRWPAGPEDPTPLGCAYPVVITHPTRRGPGMHSRLVARWEVDETPSVRTVHRVECGDSERPKQSDLARAELAGFGWPPEAEPEPSFTYALTKPVPALLWPRTGCDASHERCEPCSGRTFLDAAVRYVTGRDLTKLPHHIRKLREDADGDDSHWARDVQLLWDAPDCFPDPRDGPAHPCSPVA